MQRSVAVAGPAPPDLVWIRYVRPDRWPGWSPQIQGVDYAGDELAPGTAGVVRGPCALAVPFEILAVDAQRRSWTWRVQPPVVGALTLVHGVEPAGSGTRTTLDVSGPAPVVLAYLPVARLALGRLVR
ncbi:SRPBCC family protein [Nakamurella sp.]|uniref:SRPBCC family protein n=1 Tax=Nakamurella sp. TaxID=1869182 RepID=UPI003B3B721E